MCPRGCLAESLVLVSVWSMSAVTRPRGPLPARVYWTRRAVLLGVALALVFTLAHLLGGSSDGKSDDRGAASQVAAERRSTGTHAAAPSGRATGSAGGDHPKGDAKGHRKAPLAQPDGPCDPEDLVVRGDVGQVASNTEIRIPLKLTTRVPACTFAASNKSIVVKIVSGDDHVWSSQECPGVQKQDVVVRAAKPAEVTLVWSGRRSDVTCGRSALYAYPGWYHVIAAPLGGEPTDVQFELTPEKAVRITETAKPKSRHT